MNPSDEIAKKSYQSFLEDHFDEEMIVDLGHLVGIDLSEESPEAAIGSIVRCLNEPGALERILLSGGGAALDLLVQMLDIGDVHPPAVFRSPYYCHESREISDGLLLLKKTGLITLSMYPYEPLLVIQPWARQLMAPKVEALRQERLEKHPPSPRPAVPIRLVLALCLNHIRASQVRVTTKGELYRRQLDKANHLFEPLYRDYGMPFFEFGVSNLLKLGALRIDGDGYLEIVPSVSRDVVLASPRLLAWQILSHHGNGSTPLSLLELLKGWEKTVPDGWVTTTHLIVNGLLFIFEEVEGNSCAAEESVASGLADLLLLGLVEGAISGDTSWYRITSLGLQTLDDVESGEPDFLENAALEEGDISELRPSFREEDKATIQPSLDLLVPLTPVAEIHWHVGAIARLDSVDTLCRYTLDRRHAQAVFSRERHDGDQWLDKLKACARHGVPENVEKTLRSWLGRVTTVEVLKGAVIRVPEGIEDNDFLRASLADAADKLGAERLSAGVYLIPEEAKNSQILSILNRHGLRTDTRSQFDVEPRWEARLSQADRAAMFKALRRRLEEVRFYKEGFLEGALLFHREAVAQSQSTAKEGAPRQTVEEPWVEGEISPLLHQAVRQGEPVEIVLDGPYLNKSRTIRPDSVMRRGSKIYLTGYCLDTEENRAFPLECIARARIAAKSSSSSSS